MFAALRKQDWCVHADGTSIHVASSLPLCSFVSLFCTLCFVLSLASKEITNLSSIKTRESDCFSKTWKFEHMLHHAISNYLNHHKVFFCEKKMENENIGTIAQR